MDEHPANGTANESTPDNSGSTLAHLNSNRKRRPPKDDRKQIRYGLYLAASIPGTTYLDKQIRKYRRVLEDAVLRQYREVDETQAGIIQQCCRWAWVAEYGMLELAANHAILKPAERCKIAYNAALALQNRDAAVRSLGLDSTNDDWGDDDAL